MNQTLPMLQKITIRIIDDASLEKLAVDHYECRGCKPRALGKTHAIRRKGKNADTFLARIKVNYVRQVLSNYDHDKENACRADGREHEAHCMNQQLYLQSRSTIHSWRVNVNVKSPNVPRCEACHERLEKTL